MASNGAGKPYNFNNNNNNRNWNSGNNWRNSNNNNWNNGGGQKTNANCGQTMEEVNTYIESHNSDWLVSLARRAVITWACTNCCKLNYDRRQFINDNGDDSFTMLWHFCSYECMKFNKQQQYFVYNYLRGGDNLNGPRQSENISV